MKTIAKIFKNIVSFFSRIIDKLIVMPISKLILMINKKFEKPGKKFENWLSRTNTLLFISLVLAILIFIVIDQRILTYSESSAEVLTIDQVKVEYDEDNYVVALRNEEKNGYDACVLGSGVRKKSRTTKPYAGQFPEGIEPTQYLIECRDFDLDACSVKMSVKNETGQLLLSKTGEIFASAEGKARLKLTAADTNLVPGTYRTDIQVTFKNGDVHTVFPQDINQVGALIITPDVTEEEDGSI